MVVLPLVDMVVGTRKPIVRKPNVPQIVHALQDHCVIVIVLNASNNKLSSWSTLGNLPWRITGSTPNPLRLDLNYLLKKNA